MNQLITLGVSSGPVGSLTVAKNPPESIKQALPLRTQTEVRASVPRQVQFVQPIRTAVPSNLQTSEPQVGELSTEKLRRPHGRSNRIVRRSEYYPSYAHYADPPSCEL